jgi:putative nucleic acid modification protein with dual OB domain
MDVRIRAEFACGGVCYRFSVTDLKIEKEFKCKPVGKYPLGKTRICVSVGMPYPSAKDPCYKLVAEYLREKWQGVEIEHL